MILRARTIVTMDGPPIDNGAVVLQGEQIRAVGTFPEIHRQHTGEITDLGEQILLPGLINAHCHLDYQMLRGRLAAPRSFTEWIRGINAAKAQLGAPDYLRAINEGLAEAQRFGTTAMVNLEAFPELVSQVSETPLRIWWCAELIDVRSPVDATKTVGTLRAQLTNERMAKGGIGLAPHAPYTASPDLYAECAALAETQNLLLTTHVAESREEAEMFRESRGALFDFLREIGRNANDCGTSSTLTAWLKNVPHPERWLVAHLNEVAADDIHSLGTRAKFSIVHCPRSHRYFGHRKFPFQELRALGFNTSLGTDSLASNSDLSLFAEMRAFRESYPDVAPHEVLAMVTRNPARALNATASLGQIAPGFLADMVAIPSDSGTDSYEQVIAFTGEISWIMIGGRVVG